MLIVSDPIYLVYLNSIKSFITRVHPFKFAPCCDRAVPLFRLDPSQAQKRPPCHLHTQVSRFHPTQCCIYITSCPIPPRQTISFYDFSMESGILLGKWPHSSHLLHVHNFFSLILGAPKCLTLIAWYETYPTLVSPHDQECHVYADISKFCHVFQAYTAKMASVVGAEAAGVCFADT